MFQSTPPAWGATDVTMTINNMSEFQSTPPAWGATLDSFCSVGYMLCFNPRPPRGGRRVNISESRSVHHVSIHAPRVGGDWMESINAVLEGV